MKDNGFVVEVIGVRKAPGGEIRHYLAPDRPALTAGSAVTCLLDAERRVLHARHHTAGHLISNVVEKLDPSLKAVKCHAFPQESYVEFLAGTSATAPNATLLQARVSEVIAIGRETKVFDISAEDFERSFYRLPYDIPGKGSLRVVQIGEYSPVPCGGTHLRNIAEIGSVTIGKTVVKKGIARVSYALP
jgi:alanyl-tRNA synthetase